MNIRSLIACTTFTLLVSGVSLYSNDPLGALKEISRGFSYVSERTSPAVISIQGKGVQNALNHSNSQNRISEELIFNQVFDSPLFDSEKMVKIVSRGSGVIVSPEGYAITNYHVIRDTTEIEVTLYNKEKVKARIIGSDPDTDLAVLKLDSPKKLPFLTFGDSEKLRRGEWVIAIGYPLSLDSTLTVGVVSGTGRTNLGGTSLIQDYIQSDVVINQGSSGGPLCNIEGDIIGINSSMLTPDGAYAGNSFAIPSSIVSNVYQQIKENGSVRRGFMGIQWKPVTPEIAAVHGIESTKGVVVTGIYSDSPAEKAGLQFGDLIIQVNGYDIENTHNFIRHTWLKQPYQEITITLIRDKSQIKKKIKLGNEDFSKTTQAEAHHFGLSLKVVHKNSHKPILIIEGVTEHSAAHKLGIKVGEEIMGINNEKPDSLEHAYHLLEESYQSGNLFIWTQSMDGATRTYKMSFK